MCSSDLITPEPNDSNARRVRVQNRLFNFLVDVIKLTLDEELKSPRGRHPRFTVELLQSVSVGDERFAEQPQ